MGVTGGLPLMLFFILILIRAFQLLGRGMLPMREANDPDELILWCAGSALLAHSFTFLSISYFDQSNVTLALVLGALPGLCSASAAASYLRPQDQSEDFENGVELTARHGGLTGGDLAGKTIAVASSAPFIRLDLYA